jgi:hypothetical protein
MTTFVKGFVVARGVEQVFVDGTTRTRPEFVELEVVGDDLGLAIAGSRFVFLDVEQATALRNTLNDYLEA